MKKIIKSISLIVFLMLIATICITRTTMNQIKINDRFHHLIHKYQTNNLSCSSSVSDLTICQNNVYGNISFCEDCETVTFDMHMNISKTNDVCHMNHYRGNIIFNDSIDIYNYTIIGYVFFCNDTFNGTASVCDDDCDNCSFEGEFVVLSDNSTCHQIGADGIFCDQSY